MQSNLVIAILLLALSPAALGQEEPVVARKPPSAQVIPHPEPKPGAIFGNTVVWLDFDGDGEQDLAIGAPGESAVYIYMGPELERWRKFSAGRDEAADFFGCDLAAGPLDDEPGDELVIGASAASPDGVEKAGRVFVLAKGDAFARPLDIRAEAGASLGTSVAIGDYDGDGKLDVAAGAPKTLIGGEPSGAVYVHSIAKGETWRLENPLGSWKHGNFGHDLETGDANGNGKDDLFVSSIGNRSASGIRGAGQAYVYLNPLPGGKRLLVEDPQPVERDGARFGMSIAVGDLNGDGTADFLIGSPRKDGGGILDAGQGLVYFGPDFSGGRARIFLHPAAIVEHVLGFRALAADVVGDARKDAIFACLGGEGERAVLVWDSADLDGAPWVLPAPHEASGHFVQGFAAAPAEEGKRQVLALGDSDFNPGVGRRCGRVVIWRFDD